MSSDGQPQGPTEPTEGQEGSEQLTKFVSYSDLKLIVGLTRASTKLICNYCMHA